MTNILTTIVLTLITLAAAVVTAIAYILYVGKKLWERTD